MTRATPPTSRVSVDIEASLTDTRPIVDAFHRLYYDHPDRTWLNTYWLGVPVAKCPLDLWIYQELVYELRPDVIVECGTFKGGSALFLASLCDLVGHGRVYSIDVAPGGEMPAHPRIEYLRGSSISPPVLDHLRARIAPRETVLVILDSDHTERHVRAELELYSQFVTPGSYLILEDTNINGHPVLESFGRGPMEALDEFLRTHPGLMVDTQREKFFLTFNPRGYLRVLSRTPGGEREALEATRPVRGPDALAHDPPRALPPVERSRDTAASRVLRIVGREKSVLLIGGGDGAALAAPLAEQDCSVVLLESDPRVAASLAGACDRVVVDDPSGVDWEREVGAARFDAIVAVDALERLEDPPACLRRLRRFLNQEGVLVASVRNVAHGDTRLALLRGVFEPDGPLTRHARALRFFTRRTTEACFDSGEFAIGTLERVHRRVDALSATQPDPFVAGPVAQWLSVDEDATTSHFVVVATPLRHGSERVLRQRIRELVLETEALRAELGRATSADVRVAENGSLLDLTRQLARRDALLEQIQGLLLKAQAEVAPLREAVAHAEAQLQQHHELATKSGEEARQYAASLRAAVGEKEQELGAAHGELRAAHGELRAARAELEGVYSSRRWRIAEGLRKLWRRVVPG